MAGVSGPQFVVGKPSEAAQPNTVVKVAKIETYLAHYVDGEGREQDRIVFTIPGTDAVFMLQERIEGQFVATSATRWFVNGFRERLVGSQEKVAQV